MGRLLLFEIKILINNCSETFNIESQERLISLFLQSKEKCSGVTFPLINRGAAKLKPAEVKGLVFMMSRAEGDANPDLIKPKPVFNSFSCIML